MDEVAIKVEDVSKVFKLPHEKNSSIKSVVVNFYRRNKGYELQNALKDVSFEVKKGEFFGIVGRNGSGKSTLLKLLADIYVPTSGHIQVNGKLTPFIELGVGFNMELTGRDNIFLNGALLGFSRKEMMAMYNEIVKFAELEKFMDQKLKNYSSGMQVRLAFALAIRAKTDILLVDEVLAVGDESFQRKCFNYFRELKRNKKTVVFVSHDMTSVREFCDRGILIDGGKIKYTGDANSLAKEYSKIFDESKENNKGTEYAKKRLGDGSVEIKSARTSVSKEYISINFVAKANKKLDKLIYGIRITDRNGRDVTAMNNRMIELPDVENLNLGDEVSFRWQIGNIFSSGEYSVLIALVDEEFNPLDYLEGATNFKIIRNEKSDTAVLPPMEVHYQTKSSS